MTEQLQLDFTQSTSQRARKAEKNRDQLTLFASWAPNIDISLHSPTEAVAHIAGKDTDRGADWLRGLVGGGRALKRRRIAFPVTRLDKLAWVRPPARITLDAATHAIACAQHAHALGYKPLKIHKVGRRVTASSPRGWPTGLRVTDTPWTAVEALLRTNLPLTIEKDAEEAVAKRLEKGGGEVATATLSGNSILLTTGRPSLLENRELPALSYVGEFGDGTYRMPLLLGDAILKDKTIKVDPKAEAAIKRATKPAKPLIIDPEDDSWVWNLWDFQQQDAGTGIRALKATGGVLFAGSMGSGKNLSVSCEVATPDGMRKMGDLRVGDEVLASNGVPTRVRGVYPHRDWPLYRITFSDGTSTLAGAEHRWWVQTPAQKHAGRPGGIKTTEELIAAGLKQRSGNRKFYIPMPGPLQFSPKNLPVPPYTLGALLGDGSYTGETLTLSDDDGDVKDEILRELRQFPEHQSTFIAVIHSKDRTKAWRFNDSRALRDALAGLGLQDCRSWEKYVPEPYLYSSASDRVALLQGLLDTDGSCHGNVTDLGNHKAHSGHVEFSSTSEALADAVVWLTQSLGGTATKSDPRRTTYTYKGEKKPGRTSWRVHVSLPSSVDPFRIAVKAGRYTPRTKYQPTRGIESIEYWGRDDAVCIEVEHPSHQFVIEHGIVTMNTTVSLGVMHEMDLYPACVVLPLSAASTWARSLSELGKSYYMATGSPAKDWEAMQSGEYDAYIVSFDRLATFSDLLRTKNLKVIVADELQRAKNAGSRRSRALRSLASSVPYRIGLSGTPLVGGLSDLLAQCSFLVPTEFPPRASKKTLEDRYPGDPVQAITDHVHSIMVRRKISEVGRPLPPREDRRVNIALTAEQRKALADLEAEAQAAKEAGEFDGSDAKMNALVKLQKMRQIIASPKAAGIGGPNPKLNAGLKVTKQFINEGRQGVVFVADRQSYVDMGEMLDREGITWAGIWGSSSTEERIEAENKLHRGDVKVVLCTIQAGAESWSATPEGTFAVFCSYTYTATQLEQAEARVHRLNSDLNGPNIQIVYIHATDPAVEQSPDDRVVEILTMKRELAAQVIDRDTFEDSTLVSNSLSDLMYMLTGTKDEQLELSEKDQKRVSEEARRRKEHARATLHKHKGANSSDPNLVHDDGSMSETK